VNITGTNDVASVSSITAPVSEGNTSAALNASGMLVIADADAGDAVVVAKQLAGTYGRFNVSADGTWTYTGSEAHDRLKAGEQVSDSISVTSRDGTASGTITVNITGTNDVPVMTKPNSTYTVNGSENYSLTLIQGSAEQTIATATATDVDADAGVSLTYSLAPQNGDASADYFTMDEDGEIKFLAAAALSSTVDARDDNKDGLMDSPYVIHLVATDSYGGTSLAQTLTVNIKMAVAIDGKSAQLPGSSNDWHFAPQAQLVNDELQGDGFKLTNSSNSNIYLNLPSSVDYLTFRDSGAEFELSNDGTVGAIKEWIAGNHNISVADEVTESTHIAVKAPGAYLVSGTLDAAPDPFDSSSGLKYYRADTLEILDTPFANATFLMVGSDLQIALTGGGTKTLNDIESVVFTDRTVHIVGADGYATFKEAIEQGHIDDLDWVYGSTASNITRTTEDRKTLLDTDRSDFYEYNPPSATEDLNNLSALAGLTDFYTYNG
jgi:VCBS repeat-containing protein